MISHLGVSKMEIAHIIHHAYPLLCNILGPKLGTQQNHTVFIIIFPIHTMSPILGILLRSIRSSCLPWCLCGALYKPWLWHLKMLGTPQIPHGVEPTYTLFRRHQYRPILAKNSGCGCGDLTMGITEPGYLQYPEVGIYQIHWENPQGTPCPPVAAAGHPTRSKDFHPFGLQHMGCKVPWGPKNWMLGHFPR